MEPGVSLWYKMGFKSCHTDLPMADWVYSAHQHAEPVHVDYEDAHQADHEPEVHCASLCVLNALWPSRRRPTFHETQPSEQGTHTCQSLRPVALYAVTSPLLFRKTARFPASW